eukprot:TRINITY_DN45642_c0_g1_i1.p1 TRINITY_DN45642_c0_g1~~TRINITY_DN45642_c0_g1_i1.p1  ORF type:complete len:206 (-),score=26.07 TRINITY_DN45642_c0_g1_i1:102-689(-)
MAFRRLVSNSQAFYGSSREFVQLATQVIEEHKSLLWLVGTGSSALAGWAVYTMRRLHYDRIEGAMSQISHKIEDMEKKKVLTSMNTPASQLHTVLVVGPAVISAFSFGYLAGRAVSSFKWHKHSKTLQNLSEKRRVYVAVIPEQLFEAGTVARELENAVAESDASVTRSRWSLHHRFTESAQHWRHTTKQKSIPK